MANASSTSERIKFVDPPINELVVAIYYVPIQELKSQHIGLYWQRIREMYPRCDQQTVVATPGDPNPFAEAPGEIFPMPRFWFHSGDHPTLIQVQRNAFMLNWRRLAGGASEYPHYETVVRDFWERFTEYQQFVREIGGTLDVIRNCELSYLNIIAANEFFATPSDLVAVVPALSGLSDLANEGRELATLQAILQFRQSPNLIVDLNVRLGHRTDNNEIALGLDLKAHGAPSGLSLDEAHTWFNDAHEATYRLFLKATGKRLQEELWKPK